MQVKPFGKTGVEIPPLLFGSSDLGNLYREMSTEDKLRIIERCVELTSPYTVFDTAGKYGAGLALEVIGECLHKLGVPQDKVVISNKLGWVRAPLLGSEPTFEPGIWKGIKHDAVQKISYDGILQCFEEGNELLKHYIPQLVSVHDPDEYLQQAGGREDEEERLFQDILEAYRALEDLKKRGRVAGIGVGAKNWKIIQRIAEKVELDWVMFANSLTLINHPLPLRTLVQKLSADGVGIVNAAVFQGGFLVGGDHYNYQPVKGDKPGDVEKLDWRSRFFETCGNYGVSPAHACIQFALSVPGVDSVALSTADEEKVSANVAAVRDTIDQAFWDEMKERKLIEDLHFI